MKVSEVVRKLDALRQTLIQLPEDVEVLSATVPYPIDDASAPNIQVIGGSQFTLRDGVIYHKEFLCEGKPLEKRMVCDRNGVVVFSVEPWGEE